MSGRGGRLCFFLRRGEACGNIDGSGRRTKRYGSRSRESRVVDEEGVEGGGRAGASRGMAEYGG
jgi:hypothetical protein